MFRPQDIYFFGGCVGIYSVFALRRSMCLFFCLFFDPLDLVGGGVQKSKIDQRCHFFLCFSRDFLRIALVFYRAIYLIVCFGNVLFLLLSVEEASIIII